MRLPIRLRLTAAFAVTLAVALLAVGGFVYVRFRADADRAIDVELRNRAAAFLSVRNPGPQLREDLLGLSDEHFGQVLDRGRVAVSSAQLARRPLARALPVGFRNAFVVTRNEHRNVRLLVTRRGTTTLILASALDDRDDALGHLANLLALGGGLTFTVAALLAWVLAGAAMRPVERLRAAATSYSASDLTKRLAVPSNNDELHRLAVTLNGMLDRIQESFEGQRAFVDHASHELRTPLANLSLEVELALRRERSAAELRVALESVADETARLERLASNLLLLARTTDGLLPVAPEPTDVGALVRATTATFAARALAEGVELVVRADATTSVVLDPIRLRQAVTNLVDNALRVTARSGVVTVTASSTSDSVTIAVTDTGPGFAPSVRDAAFGLFTRGPTAHSSPDGAGLGLAIVAAVAEAHGGRATIAGPERGPASGPEHGPECGATVAIVLPNRGISP